MAQPKQPRAAVALTVSRHRLLEVISGGSTGWCRVVVSDAARAGALQVGLVIRWSREMVNGYVHLGTDGQRRRTLPLLPPLVYV